MFLNPLPPEERPAFLELAKRLIRSDGYLSPEEISLLAQIRAELDVADDEGLANHELDDLLVVFDSRRSQVIVLLELLGLSFADGEFHRSENAFLFRVARGMGVDPKDLTAMQHWVVKMMALMEEAAVFWT